MSEFFSALQFKKSSLNITKKNENSFKYFSAFHLSVLVGKTFLKFILLCFLNHFRAQPAQTTIISHTLSTNINLYFSSDSFSFSWSFSLVEESEKFHILSLAWWRKIFCLFRDEICEEFASNSLMMHLGVHENICAVKCGKFSGKIFRTLHCKISTRNRKPWNNAEIVIRRFQCSFRNFHKL